MNVPVRAATGDVVSVQFAGYGDIAVRVEALDEFVALVAEVALRREVCWDMFLGR